MSTDQMSTATRPVTLVVVYSKRETVKIEMTRNQAVQAVAHSQRGVCTLRPFYGTDTKGNPFTVDVGSAASAVYIEE